jgi:hypothetical protein
MFDTSNLCKYGLMFYDAKKFNYPIYIKNSVYENSSLLNIFKNHHINQNIILMCCLNVIIINYF